MPYPNPVRVLFLCDAIVRRRRNCEFECIFNKARVKSNPTLVYILSLKKIGYDKTDSFLLFYLSLSCYKLHLESGIKSEKGHNGGFTVGRDQK